jgi:hypothetical protein
MQRFPNTRERAATTLCTIPNNRQKAHRLFLYKRKRVPTKMNIPNSFAAISSSNSEHQPITANFKAAFWNSFKIGGLPDPRRFPVKNYSLGRG